MLCLNFHISTRETTTLIKDQTNFSEVECSMNITINLYPNGPFYHQILNGSPQKSPDNSSHSLLCMVKFPSDQYSTKYGHPFFS